MRATYDYYYDRYNTTRGYNEQTYVVVVSVMLGVLEHRMVIGVRRGLLVYGRRQRRQRAKRDHSDLEKITATIGIRFTI